MNLKLFSFNKKIKEKMFPIQFIFLILTLIIYFVLGLKKNNNEFIQPFILAPVE